MKKNTCLAIVFWLCLLPCFLVNASFSEETDYWKKWVDEVDLIMTKAEKEVFKSLKTEEDKKRFQNLFWKVRDTKPETAENEYLVEFYTRRNYAEKDLEGAFSDRGRIYILLGEPNERKNYEGYDVVVDCELWIYQSEGRPGLPPFMYLLFYRPRGLGSYRQFHPGPNSALDLLSLGYAKGMTSKERAYTTIRQQFPELARASLSVIPDERGVGSASTLTSSGAVIANIHTLPEREVEKQYLKNFSSVEGIVDVSYSTKEIGGKGSLVVLPNREFMILSYALMPDIIHTKKTPDNLNKAQVSLNIRIEDSAGKTIHQQERDLNLQLTDAQLLALRDEQKLVFKDFTPVIEGKFSVMLTFTNKTSEEFFVHKEDIEVLENIQSVLAGYEIQDLQTDSFLPFSTEKFKVLTDPQLLFNKEDSCQGIVFCSQKPEIILTEVGNETNFVKVTDVSQSENYFLFTQPLLELKTGNYYLEVSCANVVMHRTVISIMPYRVQRTIGFERTEALLSGYNFDFIMAQEYLNMNNIDAALKRFNKLPEELINSTTRPIMARAYYLKKDYGRVVELLEKEPTQKTYPVLLLLANSCLELRRLPKAAEYFEMLREYGDTIKINQTLGAIYHSLGERDKAKLYWDRAKHLEKKSEKEIKQ
ncbi:GWxTD domain-containing protein [Acidobacteriota bacterium]